MGWDRWTHLNQQEKDEVSSQWDNYYLKCKNSYWGKLFWSLRPLFQKGQVEAVKKIIAASKFVKELMIEKLEEIDPKELEIKIWSYFTVKHDLEKLKETYEEYKGVYEKGADAI